MSADDVHYPNYAGKHALDAFFGPSDFLAYLRRTGRLEHSAVPRGIVLCYQRRLFDHVLKVEGLSRAEQSQTFRGLVTLAATGHQIGVVGEFGIGAPAAAAVLEEFIALGTRRFISIGTAGALQETCPVGHTIVCDRAVRDEGVSHHYLPPGKFARSTPDLTGRLIGQLQRRSLDYSLGCSWTIDTPYRETRRRTAPLSVRGRPVRRDGGGSAVRRCRLVVSDSLADLVWDPQFHAPATLRSLIRLFEASVDALTVDDSEGN